MLYPLISEYVEAIKSAANNLNELSYLRPVLGDDGNPIMTSGNFAVVFKMKDKTSGKFYAVKCFTKEQEGREEAYHQITEELKDVDSPYLTSVRYMDKELFVDTDQTDETEFPILLMDWVEGMTLDKYVQQVINDNDSLKRLTTNFRDLSIWLLSQPYAHGDLKPDNIIVREDGTLVLVDYDGMYVPAMKGQKARELGSPDFRHPLRTENDFDEHIDDFSLLSILLSLKAITIKPQLLVQYGAADRLLFSKSDYINIYESKVFNDIPNIYYKSLFKKACDNPLFHINKEMLCPIPIGKIIDTPHTTQTNINHLRFDSSLERNVIINISDLIDIDPPEKVSELEIFGNNAFPIKNLGQLFENNGTTKQLYTRQLFDTDEKIQQKKTSNIHTINNSTKWQSALVLHILTILFSLLIYYFSSRDNNNGIWTYIFWGASIGFSAYFFTYYDYIKRDGSFGNCLLAFILLPITFYYGIYRCIYACINFLKLLKKIL